MADEDDWFDGQAYRETVKVPAILVMPGDPWPSDFYARYPNAFRVPARIVWREGISGRDGEKAAQVGRPAGIARSGGGDGGWAKEVPAEERVVSLTTEAPVPAVYGWQHDPVGAFLRVNDALNRMYSGAHAEGAVSDGFDLVATPNRGRQTAGI